ncbi:hypothetical protein Goari_000980, partial [Gossypium aridum]|nr:hypothetical protein [Gossypium aridum]
AKSDNDFELLEGDVNTTIIDSVPAIALSDHIKDILFREMELTIIVIVDGAVQRVEYEALLTVCFACGKYGHVKEMCPSVVTDKNLMDISGESLAKQTKNPLGSRFLALMVEKDLSDDAGLSAGEIVGEKANVEVAAYLGGKVLDSALGSNLIGPRDRIGSARDSGSRSNRNTSFALRGQGNHFKPSRNTRIPLVESMEAMVELLSPQILSKNLNTELDGSCANVKFPRIFPEYNMEYKPDIVSLLEQRVSGAKADSIIAKLGFQYSYRVEVIGYFRGIWLGWKDFVRLEVVCSHLQFILTQNDLRSKNPLGQIFWIAIGYFNTILSSSEKSGGLFKGRRCPYFSDFVDSVELHDLGFRGPPFIWHRGSLFERLNRALGNNAWIYNFPNCMVSHLPKIKSDHRSLLLVLNPSISFP